MCSSRHHPTAHPIGPRTDLRPGPPHQRLRARRRLLQAWPRPTPLGIGPTTWPHTGRGAPRLPVSAHRRVPRPVLWPRPRRSPSDPRPARPGHRPRPRYGRGEVRHVRPTTVPSSRASHPTAAPPPLHSLQLPACERPPPRRGQGPQRFGTRARRRGANAPDPAAGTTQRLCREGAWCTAEPSLRYAALPGKAPPRAVPPARRWTHRYRHSSDGRSDAFHGAPLGSAREAPWNLRIAGEQACPRRESS